MDITLKDSIINARADLIIAGLNGGSIDFYSDPRPLKGQDKGVAVLLAQANLQNPCGTVSSGIITFNLVDNLLLALTNGEVTWCRFLDSGNAYVLDGDCGDNSSDVFFKFDDVNFITAGRVRLNSIKLVEGGI